MIRDDSSAVDSGWCRGGKAEKGAAAKVQQGEENDLHRVVCPAVGRVVEGVAHQSAVSMVSCAVVVLPLRVQTARQANLEAEVRGHLQTSWIPLG